MSSKHTPNLAVLLRCYEALQNWRALVMLAGSFVLGGLAILGGTVIGTHMQSMAAPTLLGLVGMLIILVGLNATGLLVVDQAYDQPPRGFAAAFLGGMPAALYVFGLGILLSLGAGVVMLVAYVVTLLARIPGVGGFFGFVFGGPLVVLVAATYAVLALAGPLMVAAVWHGEGFLSSFTRAVGIVLKRPLEVLLHFLVLGILVFPAAGFLGGLVGAASFTVGGFYAAGALGGGDGGYDPSTSMLSRLDSLGSLASGAGVSMALVWFLVLSIICLIYVLGTILVYRSTSEGVENDWDQTLGGKLTELRRKIEENKPRRTTPASPAAPATPSEAAGVSAREPALAPEPAPPAPVAANPAPSAQCPSCHQAINATDVFCGGCGARLR